MSRFDNYVRQPPANGMNCMDIWGGAGTAQSHFERPGLDVWVWSQSKGSAEHGGGDLHLLSSCASGRITRMLMADVCGFGLQFKHFAGELRDLMKRNVNTIQQAGMVRHLSHRLADVSDRGCFASVLISTFFSPTRALTLCNAGQPPPLLFRAGLDKWSVLKRIQTDPGIVESPHGVVDPLEYQEFRAKLEIGDMVLSYSNALTECRNASGRTIGLEGVLQRVRRLDAGQPCLLPAGLVEQIRSEHPRNFDGQDATMVLCRATGRAVAWRDNLLAPFRLFRAVQDHTKFDLPDSS